MGLGTKEWIYCQETHGVFEGENSLYINYIVSFAVHTSLTEWHFKYFQFIVHKLFLDAFH